MNVVDWIRETAHYMVKSRPDIYDYDNASAQLIEQMEFLRTSYTGIPVTAVMTGSFIMIRLEEDEGQEEFQVAQFVSAVTTFQPEEECMVIGNPFLDINLPGPHEGGLDQFDNGLDNDR